MQCRDRQRIGSQRGADAGVAAARVAHRRRGCAARSPRCSPAPRRAIHPRWPCRTRGNPQPAHARARSRRRPEDSVCVSSMASSTSWRVQAARSASRKPGCGSTMPALVITGSASTQAMSPRVQRALAQRCNVIELHHHRGVRPGSCTRPTCPGRGSVAPSCAHDHHRLVDGAVIAAIEHQHLPTSA